MNKFLVVFVVLGLFLISFSTASGTSGQSKSEKIDDLLSMLHDQDQFNGNVLIAEKGRVIFKKSYGLANEESKKVLDENSIFELASVSKQFTAMGIVILKERGKLSYDDKITKFIPELEEFKNVSIRNLLNHTSGIPDYFGRSIMPLLDSARTNNNQDIIEIFRKNSIKLAFEPNTKYEYCNTNYLLLASIIEKVSVQKFGDFLNKSIFKPLKMKNTFVYTRRLAPRKIPDYVLGYIYVNDLKKKLLPDNFDNFKFVVYLDGIVGDGNVSSTVNDLLKWDRALYKNKLISKEGLKELFTSAILADGKPSNYSFGWFLENNKDYGEIVSHTGAFPGYKTFIERHLTNDKTIIILQNFDNVMLPRKNIREILYDQPVTKVFRKQIKISSEILAKYVGEFKDKSDEKNIISITQEDNWLIYNSTNQKWNLRFYPESNTFFFPKGGPPNLQIEFVTEANGALIIKLYQNGKVIAEGVRAIE